jgi:hypothetical protein
MIQYELCTMHAFFPLVTELYGFDRETEFTTAHVWLWYQHRSPLDGKRFHTRKIRSFTTVRQTSRAA